MTRGRMTGGSSAVNFITYNKPSKEDINGESGTMPRFRLFTENSMGAVG